VNTLAQQNRKKTERFPRRARVIIKEQIYMKNMHKRKIRAFTLIELFVLIAIIAILPSVLLAALSPAGQKAQRVACINNMKQLGVAYGIWANDHGNAYPAQQTEALGGWSGNATAPNASSYMFVNYSLMASELGQSTKTIVCPSDDRQPNTNFFWPEGTAFPYVGIAANPAYGTFNNTNVSYWVGVGANHTYPRSLLGGDRNMGCQGGSGRVPGTGQDANYGCSPQVGVSTGAYVVMDTNGIVFAGGANSNPSAGAAGWSAKLHSDGNTSGAGNILLGDGSAEQVTSGTYRSNWLRNAEDAGNFSSADYSIALGDVGFCFP
jgi:Tfp pilus assembly protein PilE